MTIYTEVAGKYERWTFNVREKPKTCFIITFNSTQRIYLIMINIV